MLPNEFTLENLVINQNYHDGWKAKYKNKDLICLDNDSEVMALTLPQAEFIVKSLSEIITYYNNLTIPNIGDVVRVTNGIFKSYIGVVKDIDNCDSKKPIVISLYDNIDFNGCACFVDYTDIEIIETKQEN